MPQFSALHFNWIDLVVAIIIARGVYLGYKRGLSGELLRFLGIVIALFLSYKFYEAGAERLMEKYDLERRIAIACSFAGISLAVIFFFYAANRMVQRMMDLPLVAAVEKGGGAILGGAKALLFACIALIVLALVKVEAISNAVSRDSYFGSLAISSVPGAYKLAVKVYPDAKKIPAEEVIEKLPDVKPREKPADGKDTGEGHETIDDGAAAPAEDGGGTGKGGTTK